MAHQRQAPRAQTAPSWCACRPRRSSRFAARCRTRDRSLRDVARHRPQPRARRPGRARGHGRGAPGQRPAELHARRPGRHRGQGGARARARGAAEQRARLPAQQAHHRQPRAGRPAEGVGPLRPADRARHPGRAAGSSTRRASPRFEFAGELSLAGDLRPVRGALAMGLALRRTRRAARRWCCRRPAPSEAALVDGLADPRRAPPARRGARAAAGDEAGGRACRGAAPQPPAGAPRRARPARREGPGAAPSARSRSPRPAATAC